MQPLCRLKRGVYERSNGTTSKLTVESEFVRRAEHGWLKKRRGQAGLPEGDPAQDAVGLALSGGGIRSATFNLGLLQALERYHFLAISMTHKGRIFVTVFVFLIISPS